METPSSPSSGDVVHRVGEVSLRMMANAIPNRTRERLQGLIAQGGDEYPWLQIVDEVLTEPVEPEDLLARGLRAQRDWFARASQTGSARAARAVRVASKTALAYMLARTIFFVLYTLAVILLLVLAKQHWPACDIYRILDWLREVVPTIFRR